MGLVGYYRRFVKGFSVIASPLTKFDRNDVKFEWNDKCQASFEQLKQLLIEALVLMQLTPGKEVTLCVLCFKDRSGMCANARW